VLAEEADPTELELALLGVLGEGVNLGVGVGHVDVRWGHQRHVIGRDEDVVTKASQADHDAVEDVLLVGPEQVDDVAYLIPFRAADRGVLPHSAPGDGLLRILRSFGVSLGVGQGSPPWCAGLWPGVHDAFPPEVGPA